MPSPSDLDIRHKLRGSAEGYRLKNCATKQSLLRSMTSAWSLRNCSDMPCLGGSSSSTHHLLLLLAFLVSPSNRLAFAVSLPLTSLNLNWCTRPQSQHSKNIPSVTSNVGPYAPLPCCEYCWNFLLIFATLRSKARLYLFPHLSNRVRDRVPYLYHGSGIHAFHFLVYGLYVSFRHFNRIKSFHFV